MFLQIRGFPCFDEAVFVQCMGKHLKPKTLNANYSKFDMLDLRVKVSVKGRGTT